MSLPQGQFIHTQRRGAAQCSSTPSDLQYHAKPERPDPLYAKKLQEVLGGQWGEISVMIDVPVPGLELPRPGQVPRHAPRHRHRGDRARRDAGDDDRRLLEGAPVEAQEDAAKNSAWSARSWAAARPRT